MLRWISNAPARFPEKTGAAPHEGGIEGVNEIQPFTLCAFADEAADGLQGQIDALKKNRIRLLELRGVEKKSVAELTAKEAQEIRARLDEEGISVWSIGSPTGKIDIRDDFSVHMDEFKHLVELAGILGASHYRLFSFYGTDGSAAARDAVLERLERLCRAAEGSGLVLCHENEKKIYGERAPACADIHRSLPAIRAIFDAANFVQAGQDTSEAWALLAPYVEYLHIKDARAKDGFAVPAGHGDGHVREILRSYGALFRTRSAGTSRKPCRRKYRIPVPYAARGF